MKKLAMVLVMVVSPALAQQPQQPPEPQITVTLPLSEYQLVMNALAKNTNWADANHAMVTMINAANAALQPPAPEGKKRK